MSDQKPEVSNRSSVVESGGSSFIGALIRKIIVLAIIVGIGFGGWWYFTKKNPEAIDRVTNRASELGGKIGGSVGDGVDRKETIEDIDATH